MVIGGEYIASQRARAFLRTKDIEVPRRKVLERVGHIDIDDYLVFGAAIGIAIAATRRKPWTVKGWRRFGGAACFGSAAGLPVWIAVDNADAGRIAELGRENIRIRESYEAEVNEAWRAWRFGSPQAITPQTYSMQSAEQLPQVSSAAWSVARTADNLQKTLTRGARESESLGQASEGDGEEADEQDPQPHRSQLMDGERQFRPQRNYSWIAESGAESIAVLEKHIDHLKERRLLLAQEAELLWHQIAVKEAAASQVPRDTLAGEKQYATLDVMGEAHVNIWLEVSVIDWMLADSRKMIMQSEAYQKGTHWIPEPTPNATAIVPKYTLQVLEELARRQMDMQELMDGARASLREFATSAASDPDMEILDSKTGKPTSDPVVRKEEILKATQQLDKEVSMNSEAMQDLIAEARKRTNR